MMNWTLITFLVLSVINFMIVLILYIKNSKKISYLWYLLIFMLIMVTLQVVFYKFKPYTLRGGMESFGTQLVVFLSMLLGMLTNSISHRIRRRKFKVNLTDLAKPFFVAPIIFFVIWGIIQKMEFNVITCCFAYTNGFFWETILKSVGQKMTQQKNVIGATPPPTDEKKH